MPRFGQYLKAILHIILLILIFFVFDQQSYRPLKRVKRFLTDIKYLLLWSKFPGLEGMEGQRLFADKRCNKINCYLTSNRAFLADLRYYDAIIFNVQNVARQDWDLPRKRSKFQKYIFASNYSAEEYPVCSPVYSRFFNLTWTYRRDSSIPYKLIEVLDVNNEFINTNTRWMFFRHMKPVSEKLKLDLNTKSKAAAVFLDECNNGKRNTLVKYLKHELEKYNLTVDVFRDRRVIRCGQTSLQAFLYRLKTKYYFYLALERYIAVDYISDIVLYGYESNAVPVVYGGADYERFLPPNSYINIQRVGVTAVARTIYESMRDKNKYYEYFRWRNHYTVKKGRGMDVCALCDFMNNRKWLKTRSGYQDFQSWWHPEYRTKCKNW